MSAPAPTALAGGPWPGLARLDEALRSGAPLYRGAVQRLAGELGPRWCAEADETVRCLFPEEAALRAAVQGYARFATEVMRLQLRFEKERVYAPKSYARAVEEVYANEAYMRAQYLPGLLLSHHLWPHHHQQHRFFEDVFLDDLRRAGARRFYDVGPGTGFYARVALAGVPGLEGVAFDVSPASKAFTEWHVAAFGAGERLRVELRDVEADPPAPVERLVCVEVLEHLEDPVRFLRALRRLLAPGGKAFVTTALNAPNADHIYLYRTAAEVTVQLEAAGFAIEQYLCAHAARPSSPGAPVAAVIAFIVA